MIPSDYSERVYSGVLGKIIGVYLGRPFEVFGFGSDQILEQMGEIKYYVHEKFNLPLVVPDDDIAGTLTFLRAMPDHGNRLDLTPSQIGQTWLNYIIENRSILWWGGMGNSTSHTVFLRLKQGVEAPRSGSMALNGKLLAEQIGAQIFIDGWAMIVPGNPDLAVDFARRAASVSHDGEGINGARMIAAMESLAFIEPDLNKLLTAGLSFIPKDSLIYRMINDIREWHTREKDWLKTRQLIKQHYGTDKYGGPCHIIPNHALVILSLLYGEDDFQRSLMIANTSGWDTDCNSGTVGCLMGIKNGLAGLQTGPDWRGPVADRLYLPTADGGRGVSDALTESYRIINIGRALAGAEPLHPKNGARFHFELPGSVQGFREENSIESKNLIAMENVAGHSLDGQRSLAIHYCNVADGKSARVATSTFLPEELVNYEDRNYVITASPTLYPDQVVRARLSASSSNFSTISCGLYLRHYSPDDRLALIHSELIDLRAGSDCELSWIIPNTGGQPIAEIGIEICSSKRASGTIYLDYLTWDGEACVSLGHPHQKGTMWRKAWVNAFDSYDFNWPEAYRLIQNRGTGLLIQGTREWRNYRVSAALTPFLARSVGIAARVQGLQRYYALLLGADQKLRLIKRLSGEKLLAELDFPWEYAKTYTFCLQVKGMDIQAWLNDKMVFAVKDDDASLNGGGIALVCEEGCLSCDVVNVQPAL